MDIIDDPCFPMFPLLAQKDDRCQMDLEIPVISRLTGINHSLPGHFEKHADLGVHEVGLLGSDREELSVELFQVLQLTVPLRQVIET